MAVPSPETQLKARELIARHGRKVAARMVGLSDATLASLAGGLRVMPATVTHADAKLAELVLSESNPPPRAA